MKKKNHTSIGINLQILIIAIVKDDIFLNLFLFLEPLPLALKLSKTSVLPTFGFKGFACTYDDICLRVHTYMHLNK